MWFLRAIRCIRGSRIALKCRRHVRSDCGLCLAVSLLLTTTTLLRVFTTTHVQRREFAGNRRVDDVTNHDDRQVRDERGSWSQLTRTNASEPQFTRWRNEVISMCDGRVSIYGGSFARLRDVIVDRKLFSAARLGGESIADVMNQDVGAEFYRLRRGGFRLFDCNARNTANYTSTIQFASRSYLNSWLAATEITMTSFPDADEADRRREGVTTVAVTRDEYANLYHTTSDWYNVFLATMFFDDVADVSKVRVLLVDAHPAGPLDDVWNTLFDGTRRLSQLETGTLTQFDDLIWATPGHRGLFEQHFRRRLPFIEEFRRFVLLRHQLDFRRTVDCSNVSVLIVWRRDYVTHPRNPTAVVRRKIANENELEAYLRRENPTMRIAGIQLDLLPVRSQLRVAANSDVIIGMHGAGLTHAMFMPLGSALVELMPGYNTATNWHFRSIARWRSLVYENWIADQLGDDSSTGYRTTVSPEAVDGLLRKAVRRMCHNKAKSDEHAKKTRTWSRVH